MAYARFLLLPFAILFAASDPAHTEPAEPTLFHIKRNTNANELDYRARLAGCRWAEKAPIHPVWRMLEEAKPGEPLPEEELSVTLLGDERKVYGPVFTHVSALRLQWHVKIAPEVRFSSDLSAEGGRCRVTTTTLIDGKPARVALAYVHFGTFVRYFTIYGCRDGVVAQQRFIRAGRSGSSLREAERQEASRVDISTLCSSKAK